MFSHCAVFSLCAITASVVGFPPQPPELLYTRVLNHPVQDVADYPDVIIRGLRYETPFVYAQIN